MRKVCCNASWESGLTLIAFIDISVAVITVMASLILFTFPGMYNMVQEMFHENSMQLEELNYTVWAIFLSVLVVLCLMYLAVEVVLFLTLREGSADRSYQLCHRWFYIRLTLLIFSCIITIYRIASLEYSPYDAVFEPVKFYRVIELIFVKNFMTDVKKGGIVLSKTIINDIIHSI